MSIALRVARVSDIAPPSYRTSPDSKGLPELQPRRKVILFAPPKTGGFRSRGWAI